MNYLKTFLPYLFGNKKGMSLSVALPNPIPWPSLCFEEILMFHALKNTINQYVRSIDLKTLSRKDMFHLFNFLDFLNYDLNNEISTYFTEDLVLYYQSVNKNSIKAKEAQELLNFKNHQLTVFALLHSDRTKPGVLVIRTAEGKFVMNKDHSVWSIPILAFSGRGLAFNHSNGHTPCGVYTIDSVMANADKKDIFGEFRRLIVNFIQSSPNELELKKLIPKNHHGLNWWRSSVVGRELGRHLLRIHGTGRTNPNPLSPFFPFVPTSGCLATNEASFMGLMKFNDQRLLLDSLMAALNIPSTFENESKIHGLLYVVELDDSLASLSF